MTKKDNLLFIVSSVSKLGNSQKNTGSYLPEVAHVYTILSKHFNIIFASPNGGSAPIDPESIEQFKRDYDCILFLQNDSICENADIKTIKTSDVIAEDYVAVYFPGGHACMFDLAFDKYSQSLAGKIWENNGIIGSVCHGLAGIVNAKLSNGEYLLKGKRITCFSNSEEKSIGLSHSVPFLLEDAAKKNGGIFKKKGNWECYVEIDGNLVTGQNPASASEVGEAILALTLKKQSGLL